jgi:hypothetical protein
LLVVLVLAACLAGTLVLVGIYFGIRNPEDPRQIRRLPDGSTLLIESPVFTATNFFYKYESGNRYLRQLSRILPPGIRQRFRWSSGSFGFGLDRSTNLLVISITRYAGKPSNTRWPDPSRLRVVDDSGNQFDACWGSNTLGMGDATVHGWQIRAFPRRSRMLRLQFLTPTVSLGGWTNVAEFTIPNPAYTNYPQWDPEPVPATKSNGSLAVTLAEFQSGGRMSGPRGIGAAATVARKTRLAFTFAENGMPATNWMIQKLIISDATGNEWFPYLDFVRRDFNWAQGGTVEFFGALWPGEQAWKLNAEVMRSSGFRADELREVVLDLPTARTVNTLTNQWEQESRSLQLVALGSPETDHSGDFKWVAKWWGANKSQVYTLALRLEGDWTGWRPSVVGAVDQAGAAVKIVQHGSQDSARQAVFFTPNDESTQVRFTFALQRSRFVEFLARPEFVRDSATNRLSEADP